MTLPKSHRFRVSEEDAGLRLDQLLAKNVTNLSRQKAKRVLELGGVFVDRRRVKVARRMLRVGQLVEVNLGALHEDAHPAEAAEELVDAPRLVYSDEEVVVVDKPTNMPSAPTRESDRHDLRAWLAGRFGEPVYVVHRLDRPTSGLLVFARERGAAARLNELLQQRQLVREYLLAVEGDVPFESRRVSTPVAGKPAETEFVRVARLPSASLLRARLATGRTHQIRVHAASIGYAVLGDSRYGRRGGLAFKPPAPRLALHAARLAFPHPSRDELLEFDSEWPSKLSLWWEEVRRAAEPSRDEPSRDENP